MTQGVRALVALLAFTMIGVACSSSDDDTAADGRPTVTITARDDAVQIPSHLDAGWTELVVTNAASTTQQVQLARLGPEITYAQVQAAADAGDRSVLYTLLEPFGGAGAVPPGEKVSLINDLVPGAGVALLTPLRADGAPVPGAVKMQRITVDAAEGFLPPSFARDAVVIGDGTILVAPLSRRGRLIVRNAGDQDHELVLIRVDDGRQLSDVLPALATPGTTSAAGATAVTGIAGLKPGATGFLELDLDPGRYVLADYLPNMSDGGAPWLSRGVVGQAEVR